MYGHINNMYYYQFIAGVVNEYLMGPVGVDVSSPTSPIMMIVASSAQFYAAAKFPSPLKGGFRIKRIGKSSVTYQVGIFADDEDLACVVGEMTHVYVDPATQRPVSAIPNFMLSGFKRLE
ncbi:HotDog domain-containing protein [Chlamydoabsidia padenii]|nr:HotDog domain-containing protein [Chlamydoabsidia padenii]